MKEFGSPYKQLDRKINTWCRWTKRLDTYGCGCQHDCKYCYAKSLLNFRGLWDAKSPIPASMGEIHYQIKKLGSFDVVRLGGMTDCFQPLEKYHKITYKTIQLLNYYKIQYLIVTKSCLVASDDYIKIYNKELAHFQITLTSTNQTISKRYENASVPKNRIVAIEKLYSCGFDVSLRLSPYLPENVDLKIINSIKCTKILVEFLKVNHWIEKFFKIDYKDYTFLFGSFKHLQLEQKINLIKNIEFEQISVGEYVKDHHLYFSGNVNFNKEDCCNLNLKIVSKPTQLTFNYET